MKRKISIGIFVLLVSILMLMSNASASGWPVAWANQATLSTVDSFPSQDPENSGYGTTQVVVWEEWNGNDWDIHMKYSLLDGALLSWIFPPVHPATTALDEINPAVTITGPDTWQRTWIHVVYQRVNPAGPANWDICHTFTLNFGGAWSAPTILDVNQAQDAIDPAIVYTEDIATRNGITAFLAQIVWSETSSTSGFYEIQYDAFYLDTNLVPITGYVGPTLIRGVGTGATGDCLYPEIASVDETGGALISSFPFSVVWQEQIFATGQWNVWYDDGTTTTFPILATVLTPGSTGQLNTNLPGTGNCEHPDIAATQDYGPIATQRFYYHVNWVYNNLVAATWQIDTCYATGIPPFFPNPGWWSFVGTPPAQGPVAQVLDNPTIASKLTTAPAFDTWMAWEDSTTIQLSNPDIWFIVGTCGPPLFLFAYAIGPGRVGYLPPAGGGSIEYNPELWNRNDAARPTPPLTHLVFDQDLGTGIPEVEYIDP